MYSLKLVLIRIIDGFSYLDHTNMKNDCTIHQKQSLCSSFTSSSTLFNKLTWQLSILKFPSNTASEWWMSITSFKNESIVYWWTTGSKMFKWRGHIRLVHMKWAIFCPWKRVLGTSTPLNFFQAITHRYKIEYENHNSRFFQWVIRWVSHSVSHSV